MCTNKTYENEFRCELNDCNQTEIVTFYVENIMLVPNIIH